MRKLMIVCGLLLMTACQESPPPAPLEPLKFASPVYTFNVADIRIVQDYKSPKRPPNVEHLADITPAEAAKQWAGVRLAAAGHDNSLEVDIEDASIVRKDLPKQKTGIEGMFTTEQTEEYDGRLTVEMRIYNPRSVLAVARLTVTATQTMTLPEDTTPLDREHLYHRMTVDLIKQIEPQLDANIHGHLAGYLL